MIPNEERSTAVGEVWWVQWAVPVGEMRGQGEAGNEDGSSTHNVAVIKQPVNAGLVERRRRVRK